MLHMTASSKIENIPHVLIYSTTLMGLFLLTACASASPELSEARHKLAASREAIQQKKYGFSTAISR
jgi:uncharacterized lipoprotein YajG